MGAGMSAHFDASDVGAIAASETAGKRKRNARVFWPNSHAGMDGDGHVVEFHGRRLSQLGRGRKPLLIRRTGSRSFVAI